MHVSIYVYVSIYVIHIYCYVILSLFKRHLKDIKRRIFKYEIYKSYPPETRSELYSNLSTTLAREAAKFLISGRKIYP